MLNVLNNFNPVAFLEIDTTSMQPEETSNLSNSLNNKISEYILLKLSDNLSDEQFQKVVGTTDPEEMMKLLGEAVPNLEARIKTELENFKNEYRGEN